MPTTLLARDFDIEVYDGSEYVEIDGLNTFTLSQSVERSDTTVFSSEGQAEHVKSQIARTVTAEGYYMEDSEGERDPGQEEVEKLADEIGSDAEETLHIASKDGGLELWMNGTFALSDIGGGNNDPASWGFEFERTGDTLDEDPNSGT